MLQHCADIVLSPSINVTKTDMWHQSKDKRVSGYAFSHGEKIMHLDFGDRDLLVGKGSSANYRPNVSWMMLGTRKEGGINVNNSPLLDHPLLPIKYILFSFNIFHFFSYI